MAAKEAINILAKMQNYDSKENVEALEIAIDALEKVETLEAENARLKEKETPKEPRHVKEGYAYCPTCGDNANEWLGDELISYKFCSNCGQAIKNDKE